MDKNVKNSICTYVLLFFTFSIFGWIYEVVLTYFQLGIFVNRGALFGPWLPLYGYGGVIILLLTSRIKSKKWLTYLVSIVCAGILEYLTSWYLEVFVHKKYWDYSNFYFNIGGRTCLEVLLVFGLFAMFFIYIAVPFLKRYFTKISKKVKYIICIILILLFGIDKIHSYIHPNTGVGVATDMKL